MKYYIFLISFFLGFSSVGQSNLLNAKKPGDITNSISVKDTDNFLDYEDIDEKDILWSKVVYEEIDLDQKLNFPLLFPTNDTSDYIDRKSLWRVLKEYILSKVDYGSSNYPDSLEIYVSDKFSKRLTKNQIKSKIQYKEFSPADNDSLSYEIGSQSVGGYKIKGVWYFDKLHSELRYRLLGIMPLTITISALESGDDSPNLMSESGLWIWYPSIRRELDKHLVFNDKNNNSKISFDELLINRRFDSYIYKYDNVYGNRSIDQYIVRRPGESEERLKLRRILESERIKKEILDFEIDMWGY